MCKCFGVETSYKISLNLAKGYGNYYKNLVDSGLPGHRSLPPHPTPGIPDIVAENGQLYFTTPCRNLAFDIRALSALIVRGVEPGIIRTCSGVYKGSHPRYCILMYL